MSILPRLLQALPLILAATTAVAQLAPLAETAHSNIEYASPGAAYRALRADPTVQLREQDGWVIANDTAQRTLWTFSPKSDPAFPAVVKRQVVERDGQLALQMGVLCGASKTVCDDFVRRFQQLNDALAREVQRRAGAASAP